MSSRPQPKPPADDLPKNFWDEDLSEADLTPEELEDIRASEADIAAGRTFSNEEFVDIFGPLAEKISAGTVTPADFEAVEKRIQRR
ncbi:hypothetical protein [Azospirillum sp.]|uniref:hypothetical protein n=1 Tax=Azospirillum sp. TaxID=34012 RepID=UPI003D720445